MSSSAKELAANLASVEPSIRSVAFGQLSKMLPQLSPETYRSISIGVYYYFWYCDGALAQEEASLAIAKLDQLVDPANRRAWTQSVLATLVKFWERLDYHRQNKFLGLVKDLFEAQYEQLFKNGFEKKVIADWNQFLTETVLNDDKGKEIALELLYRSRDIVIDRCETASALFLSVKPFLDVS